MTYIGNSPDDKVVIRLQARKSFALGLWLQDHNENPLNILNSTIRLVVRKPLILPTVTDDSGNLITSSTASILSPTLGFARFEIQASELDHPPGEYVFSIVLIEGGYSSVIVDGLIQLEQNTEFASMSESFVSGEVVSTALQIVLRGGNTLKVRTGPTLAPGAVTFTAAMEQRLLQIYAGALAAGQTLDADDIADGVTKVMMTAAERDQLLNLSLDWGDIENKPLFGTASLLDEADVFLTVDGISGADISSGTVDAARLPKVSEHEGFTSGTAVPSGGAAGDLYYRYTA